MAFVVRLVPGEWKKDENGFFEHVSQMDGFALAVRLREQDGFAKVVMAVKEKLMLRPEDDIELTYQWPQWMMGPDWRRANPIDILDDEDMTLFMAIRADLDEVHLRAKIIRGGNERNVNSYRSNMDLSGLSSKEISDRYWNSAETRAVWGTALTRMLLSNISGDADGMTTMGKDNEMNISKAGEQHNTYGGVTIRDNMDITTGTSGTPTKLTQPGAITSLKGKEKVIDDEERERDRLFEVWQKTQQEEMWREMCSTQMTLGGTQTNPTNVGEKEKTARVLDFGGSDQAKGDPNENLRLTLASAEAQAVGPPVVALSSSDSSFGTPTSLSTSISFSTEDVMDDTGSSNNNSLSLLDDGLSTKEIEMPSTNTRVSEVQRNEMIVKDTPVPTVFYDRDGPPYFDDPGEEDALQRALKDADYEGDDIYIGRIFKTKEDCATKLAIHAIRRKFHFIYAKSRPNVVAAVCVSHTCPWRVYATKLADSDRFQVYPMSSHAACIVHLKRNIEAYFKSDQLSALVSSAARAYRLSDFNRIFAEIRAKHGPCADYLAESIRTTLVTWFALRRQAAQLEDNILPPKVHDMVIENYEKGAGCAVIKIRDGLYEVREKGGAAFAVNLWERTCTCREFQLLTIPCSHAIAAAIQEGIRVDTMVGVHHTTPSLGAIEKGSKEVFWRGKWWMDVVRINREKGLAM
ncbi:unnamed protein product [Arabidopsis arenosa]|uniref:SWIM-type domain-containing protein n=1 Tax=Arabidopsis arenosa TaxID=38785 RepID=A0A8S1ZHX7_ARAAE|nr:unnamed protein product [Arabidopsis arenosa]